MSTQSVLWCTLDVWALRVDVVLVPPSSTHLRGEVAAWDGETCTIYISWALPLEMAELSFVHELGHAGIEAAGTGIAGTSPSAKHVPEAEEGAVNLISAVLYGSLKQNRLLQLPSRPLTPYDRARVRKARMKR